MEKINENYEAILQELGQYVQAVGYQINSQKGILRGAKEFVFWLQKKEIMQLEQVERQDIKQYQNYLETRQNKLFVGGLSSKMVRDYLWTASLLFKLLEQQGKLTHNPLSGYELPAVSSEKRAILSLAETQRLYHACTNLKERCILHIYYGLGLRRSEGEALNLLDVDYRNGWLFVRKGKGGQGRNMPLTPSIQEDFRNYILYERPPVPENALLLNKKLCRLQGASALIILKKLLRKANITKTIDLHCLRHSIATHLINQGMKMEQVREYLGHRHLESTQNYIRYDTKKIFNEQIYGEHLKEL